MKHVKFLKPFKYAGVSYKKGQKAKVSNRHFKVLEVLKKVEEIPEPAPTPDKKSPVRSNRSMAPRPRPTVTKPPAQSAKTDDSESESSDEKSGYERKDVTTSEE